MPDERKAEPSFVAGSGFVLHCQESSSADENDRQVDTASHYFPSEVADAREKVVEMAKDMKLRCW